MFAPPFLVFDITTWAEFLGWSGEQGRGRGMKNHSGYIREFPYMKFLVKDQKQKSQSIDNVMALLAEFVVVFSKQKYSKAKHFQKL